MSTTFAAFFIDNADCLSASEKGEALDYAAFALRCDPSQAQSYYVRQELFEKGCLHPVAEDAPEFAKASNAALQDWVDRAARAGIRTVARELSDAAQALAEKHELCPTHWCPWSECDHAADAADRAHDRYRGEGCD